MDVWPGDFHGDFARRHPAASGWWGRTLGGVKFDPTVNLGHIITAIVFLVTAVAGWSSLDGRQTRLEERTVRLEQARERDDRDTVQAVERNARMAAQVEAALLAIRRIEGLLDRPGVTR